jgi:dihydrodipicolinate reductase
MNTMTDIKVVVNGALGRMGQEVLNAVHKAEGLTAVAGSDGASLILLKIGTSIEVLGTLTVLEVAATSDPATAVSPSAL